MGIKKKGCTEGKGRVSWLWPWFLVSRRHQWWWWWLFVVVLFGWGNKKKKKKRRESFLLSFFPSSVQKDTTKDNLTVISSETVDDQDQYQLQHFSLYETLEQFPGAVPCRAGTKEWPPMTVTELERGQISAPEKVIQALVVVNDSLSFSFLPACLPRSILWMQQQ